MAKFGDFVTIETSQNNTRQGIMLRDGFVLGESGTVYKMIGDAVVVPDRNLLPMTEDFVNAIRKAFGIA